MNYIYILSIVLLLILLILVRKSKKYLNIINTIIVIIIVVMSYISSMSYLFTLIKIPINLISMIICNILVSCIIFIKIKKDKEIQKYYLNKYDIITSVIFIGICVILFFVYYESGMVVRDVTPDGSAHFLGARTFAINDSLNMKEIASGLLNFEKFQFFGISNLGMVFKCFPWLNSIEQYKIYCIYNLFLLFIAGYSFYMLISNNNKNIKNYILVLFISLLYLLGYPIVSLVYGFFYWGLGGTIICIILYLCNMYIKREYNNNLLIFLIGLLNFWLFCCYYLFVPVIYLSIFIFILYYYSKNKNVFSKKEIIKFIIFTLVIPFLLGFFYFIFDNFITTTIHVDRILNSTKSQGGNYKNLIGNYLFLIPFIIHGICLLKKDYKNIFLVTFMITLLTIIMCFVLVLCGFMSSYYFYKFYYIINILIFYLIYKSSNNLLTNNNAVGYGLLVYPIFIIISCLNFDNKLIVGIDDIGNISSYNEIVDIYKNNYLTINKKDKVIDKYSMQSLEFIINNKNKLVNDRNEIAMIGTYWQRRWFEAITDTIPKINYKGNILEYYDGYNIYMWGEEENSKYLIIFNYEIFDKYKKDKEYDKYNQIFKNKSVLILEKK